MELFDILKGTKDTIDTISDVVKSTGKLADTTKGSLKKVEGVLKEFANIKKTYLKKSDLKGKVDVIPLDKVQDLDKNSNKTLNNINTYLEKNKDAKGKLQKVESLKEGNLQFPITPEGLIIIGMLVIIEKQVDEIKKTTKDIYNFLQYEKESEIESNYQMLEKINRDYKYYIDDDRMLISQQTNVTNIQKESKSNMLLYKKQINDLVLKDNTIVINNTMETILENLGKKFDYYRLAINTWAYSSLTELYLLKNYKKEYLDSKKEELSLLKDEYKNLYDLSLSYIEKNASKSIEGNTLKVVGKAGEAVGNFVESLKDKVSFMKDKDYDKWLKDKGTSLTNKGDSHIEEFINKFKKEKETSLNLIMDEIEKIDLINNNVENIYFDESNIYIEYK